VNQPTRQESLAFCLAWKKKKPSGVLGVEAKEPSPAVLDITGRRPEQGALPSLAALFRAGESWLLIFSEDTRPVKLPPRLFDAIVIRRNPHLPFLHAAQDLKPRPHFLAACLVVIRCRGVGRLDEKTEGFAIGLLAAEVRSKHHDGIDAGVFRGGAIEMSPKFF
jgi:hypothetical protein